MKIWDLREFLEKFPNEMEINFSDGNFGDVGVPLHISDIAEAHGQLLIRPPYWEPVE